MQKSILSAANLLTAMIAVALAPHAFGQSLYWDANNTDPGAGATPTGIWGTDLFWNPLADGTGTPDAWVSGSTAVFSAGGDATTAFTVTVNGTQTAGGVTIEEGTVSFAGGTIAVGTGTINVNAGATLSTDGSLRISATAGANLNVNGATVRTSNPGGAGTFINTNFNISIGAGGATFSHITANINNIVQPLFPGGTISGPGTLTKTGAGVLSIAAAFSHTGGTVVSDGELRIRTTANRLPVAGAVTVNSPGIFNLNAVSQQIGSLSGNGDVGLGSATLTVGDATSTTFNGAIKDIANAGASPTTSTGGKLVKTGSGTLTLTQPNPYTGTTTVANGTLRIANTTGSATGSGSVTVAGAGTLSGPGSVTGPVIVNGTIAPGSSPGTLNSGPETWNSGASYVWEINDVDAGAGTDPGWDLINITGALTNNATSGNKFKVKITSLTLGDVAGNVADFDNTQDYAWTIVKTTTGIIGFDPATINLDTSAFSNPTGTGVFQVQTANGGNDLVLLFVHPPSIVAGPVGGTAECGSTFNLTVTASGSTPLAYQWKHEGTNLPGANGTSLSVTASAATAGSYVVDVSNTYGSASSSPVTLTVQDTTAPGITCPANITGVTDSGQCSKSNVTYSAGASDTCSGVTVACLPASGSTFALGTSMVTCTATDGAGNTNACTFTVTINDTEAPSITCVSDMSTCTASNSAVVTFTVTASDACDIDVAVVCTPASGSDFPLGTNAVHCVATDDAGNTNTCSFNVVVSQNTTATGPTASSVCTGGTITLSTVASGTGPFAYQWRKNGSEMVNETNSSITISGASQADATTYCVEVTGHCNSVTNCAALSVIDLVNASGPANTTVCAGGSVTLATTASGVGPFTYQWRKNGNALANETNSSYSIGTAVPGDSGNYCVEVTGACASVTNCAVVTVNPAPNVSVNSPSICTGGSATLTATHNASSPSFLWSPGGATTASITVFPSSTTTYTVTVTDGTTTCSASASGTVTVNPSFSVTVNSATICQGNSAVLTATSPAGNPSYLWSPGGATTASITVSPTTTTTYTCTVTDGNTGCNASGSGTVTVRGFNTFANSSTITVNDNAAASPYPSPITISTLTATVCRVTVTLNGVSHAFPDDLDIALVGPNGEAVLLMSDVGGANAISGVNLTFDDFASTMLPDSSQIVSGTFKPSNIGAKSDGRPDNFPAPAPTTRYDTNLSAFSGINPNGTWKLFVLDDELVDAGQIAGGWSLSISTLNPIADVGVSQLDIPDPVAVGSNLTYTVTVTNNGPAAANNVLASDTPPTSGATLVSYSSSQGSCTLISGTVWCALGSIAPHASATLTVVMTPTATGTLANTASVTADEVDFVSANNSSTASTTVRTAPTITTGPVSQVVCADHSVSFSVVATGDAPLSYQWYQGVNPIGGATATSYTIGNAQPSASGSYTVVVNNDVGAASASANLTVNPLPTVTVNSPTICNGQSATLAANNNASSPTYLWSPGSATTASITVSPTTTTTYTVLVTDGTTGCTNSASGTITVNQLTTATPLTSVTNACPGTSVSFATTAGGTGPFTYVWRKNGSAMSGQTGPSITFGSVAAGDAATYCVEVTGACNTVTNCATLTVVLPPTIASQPQNQSAPMGNTATFSLTVNGTTPFAYQWKQNGADIPGATAATLTVGPVTLAQSGNTYSVVVSNCAGQVTSTAATLTVTPIAGISFDFNTPGQFTNTPYNIRLNDWLHTVLPGVFVETATGGVGGSGALDVTGNADASAQVHPVSYDFSLDGKTLVASVMIRIVAPTANGRATQIGFITQTNGFQGTAPGLTGAGFNDNNPIGFMSVILQSTAQPALTYQLRLQHRRTDGSITEVTPTPTPQATLVAGNWYKLVATFQNIKATAADTFTVAASLQDMGTAGTTPGATAMSYTPTNIVNSSIAAQRNMFLAIRAQTANDGADLWDNIYAYTRPGPIAFVAQPASQTVVVGGQTSFQALVDGEGPYRYQWNKNGSPIPGAGNWRYITGAARLSENGDQYTVTVTGPDNTTVISSPATLTVQPATLALVSAGSVDGGTIGLQFNLPLDKITAENPANYLVNGVAATSARLFTSTVDTNPTRVVITPPGAALSAPYTVAVQNVRDFLGNLIGAANSANGRVEGLAGVDINPLIVQPPGFQNSFGPGQVEITGAGADIFTSPDSFHYVYRQQTGDFDVKLRVPYQDAVRASTKAGFDARISLDPTAPQIMAAINPRWPGRQLYEGTFRQIYASGGNSWGAAGTVAQYPNTYLRLRRVANTFMRYSSQNGTTWQLDGQVSPSPAFPDTILLGLQVCSAAQGSAQTASIDNYDTFAGYPGATIAITTQPVSSATVAAGSSSNLTVVATITGAPAAGELAYVWQRNAGGGVWTNVIAAGATNNILTVGPVLASDNGAQYRVIVKAPGAADVISTTTTLTVTDTAAPTITAATIPAGANAQIVVTYSEAMSASAVVAGNYVVTNAAGANMGVSSAVFLGPDPRTVVLTTISPLIAGTYGLSVSGVQDLGGNTIAPTLRSLTQGFTVPVTGPVVVEFYTGLTNSTTGIADLTNNTVAQFAAPSAKFAADTPDFTTYSNVFAVNPGGAFPNTVDNYGAQLYSYFVAPTNGQYKFYLRVDDFGQFYMNTNATGSTNPAGAVLQINITANNANYTAANSVTNTLVGGQKYYIEVRFKETTGGDGVSLAVRNDNTTPVQAEVLSSSLLAFPDAVAKPTPVVVELYTGLVTLNSPDRNDLGASFLNGGYPDFLAAVNSSTIIARNPNVIGYARDFGFNTNLAQVNATFDNYFGRMYGNFIAPSNGLYRFWARSDDSSELWMNTNAVNSTDPAGITRLGVITDFYNANYRPIVENVFLVGGQRYYIEGRWRDGTGGDGMWVTYRAQGDTAVPPNTEIIPGSRMEFPANFDRVGSIDAALSPLNPVVTAGQTVTFQTVGLRGAPPYSVMWLKNGLPVQVNALTFVTQPLTSSDNGAVFTMVASNLFSRVERATTVTVLNDNTAPTILSAVGSQYGDTVLVTFSEPVNPLTAGAAANYQVNNGLGVYSATLDPDTGRRVTLRTTPQTPGTTYTITVNNVRDMAGNAIAPNTRVAFTGWILAGKGFYVEFFTNTGTGTAVANLLTDQKYINNWPDNAYYTNRFGVSWLGNDSGLNNYGARVTTLFSPPTNGLYRFYIRGDDGTQLFMNTNGPSPAGRVLVARNDGANSSLWDNGTGGSASPILTLNADTLYFMEAFIKEGGGGDHMEVMLRAIDPNTLVAITGVPAVSVNDIVPADFFAAIGNPDRAGLTVVQSPPANVNAAQNDTVTLKAYAYAANFELSQATGYRWQIGNGVGGFANIPGAVGPTYTFVAPATDTQYRVVISGPGTNAVYTSTVHSSPDNKAPFILSASSLNGTNLDVIFNEPVDPLSSQDPFSWEIDGGARVPLSAVQRADPRKVTVTVDAPVGATFTISASGVSDAVGNFDYSIVTGKVSSAYVALDVGAPVAVGSTFAAADGEFDVVAGGNDIWGTADVGHLTLTQITGDFDVHVRVGGLTRPDAISKAGLMVRETLDANSRTLHTLANPAQYQQTHPLNTAPLTGRDLAEGGIRFAVGQATAGWQARPESLGPPSLIGNSGFAPAGVPNTWLRITRRGNLFTAYHGYDGVNWRLFAQLPVSYPKTVYVGMATCAHTASQAANLVTVANYRDLYVPPPPIILVQPSPSTRTVPLHASVAYSVVASNPPPNVNALKYQWFRNGVAIQNATGTSLTIPDAKPADAGVYTVDVNNDGGTVTSIPVTLNVDSGLIAGTDAINTIQNQPVNVNASTLLANDSAASGDTPSIVAVSGIFPVTYTADFNNGLPAGATIAGNATLEAAGGVNNSGYVRLNPGAGNQVGGLVLSELSPNRRVTAFNASFKLRIADGSAEPADGFSFNFGPNLPPTAGAAENGVGSGFSFCVDNYQFHPYPLGGLANTSGLKIRYGNLDIAGVRSSTWNTPRWVDVSISITPQGALTVLVDGTNVFGNVTLPNYAPARGQFGWYARTGGQFQSHAIDDVNINALLTVETTREPAQGVSGPTLLGTALINGGVLHLTDAAGNQGGSYIIGDIAGGVPLMTFQAAFKLRMGGGTAVPADGFSFCFGNDVAGLFGEEGMGTNLIVSFDSYDNGPIGTPEAPAVDVKWNGANIASVFMPVSQGPSGTRMIDVLIKMDSDGTLDVVYDGTNIFTNLQTPYTTRAGRFGMGARTGGATDNHWVDDLVINGSTDNGPFSFSNDFNTTPASPYGTVVLNGSVITYTPPANVCGPDTFYYLISGQNGGTAVGRIDVTIAEANPTPPVITACPTNRTIAAGANCQAALPDMTAELVATDNCCCPAITQNPPAGTLLGRGPHVVTFTATDTAGLTAQCQATITVADQTPPVIALIGGPVTIECHSSTPIPGATAQDDCDGDLTSQIVVGGAVNRNVPGTYTVTYNVSDTSGNPATQAERIVTVADTTPPSIICPANITTTCTGGGGAVVTFAPTVLDICDAAATFACTPASGSTFAVGVTPVRCVAHDASGNTNVCSFTVTVNDTQAQLTIVRASTNTVTISWPQTCASQTLEQSDKIGPGAHWTTVPGSPALVSGRWTITVQTTGSTRFYRLRSP